MACRSHSPLRWSRGAPRVVGALLCAAVILLGSASATAQVGGTSPDLIDLRDYAPPLIQIGDFERRSDQFGGTTVSTLRRASPWKKAGVKRVWENLVNGAKVGTTTTYTRGKRVFRSNVSRGDLKIVPKGKRKIIQDQVLILGETQKTKDRLEYFFQGQLGARARVKEEVTYLVVEEVMTDLGTFAEAAKIERISTVKLSFPGTSDRQRIRTTETQWLVLGIGPVLTVQRVENFVNGALQIDTGQVSIWLDDITSGGESLFPAPPSTP